MKVSIKYLIFFITVIIALFKVTNYFGDRSLEAIHQASKPIGQNNIIVGEEAVEIKNGSKIALVIIHGYTSSPSRFYHLINYLDKNKVPADIYAPLLPFHGRELSAYKSFDNEVIKRYIKDFLAEKSKEYEKLLIIGESYGAVLLVDIINSGNKYPNAEFIFSSPGFYMLESTSSNVSKAKILSWIMDYCPTCYDPYLTDEYSAKHARYAQKHGVVCLHSMHQMMSKEQQVRDILPKFDAPHTMVSSLDDDVTDAPKVKEICEANLNCTPMFFEDGGHFVHWGKHAETYQRFILQTLKNMNIRSQ